MVAASILPVTIHNNELYFLFGKENDLEESAKGWSDFGGGVENSDSIYETALREGGEELTGFLGDNNQLKKYMKKHGGYYYIKHNTYHVHMIYLEYDENLVKYYNNNHAFLWKRMDRNYLKKPKFFEKIEIGWFSLKDIANMRGKFRPFYEEIVDNILSHIENIRKFILKRHIKSIKNKKTRKGTRKNNKTRKNRV